MRLNKEKLIATWRIGKRIFNDPANNAIINRYNKIKDLFHRIIALQISYDESTEVFQIDNNELQPTVLRIITKLCEEPETLEQKITTSSMPKPVCGYQE